MGRRCRPGLLPRGKEVAPVGTSVLPCDCITPGLMPTEATGELQLLYAIDYPNEGYEAAGFETNPLHISDSRDNWGVFPELFPGYYYFVNARWVANTSLLTDDPVDGDRYLQTEPAIDNSYWLEAAFLSYGVPDWTTYGYPDAWLAFDREWPVSGAIAPGQELRFRFAHRELNAAAFIKGAQVAWLGGSGNIVLGTPIELPAAPSNGIWMCSRTSGIDTISGLPDDEMISTPLIAPSGAVGFSLVLSWYGAPPFGGGGSAAFDALRFEVWGP